MSDSIRPGVSVRMCSGCGCGAGCLRGIGTGILDSVFSAVGFGSGTCVRPGIGSGFGCFLCPVVVLDRIVFLLSSCIDPFPGGEFLL